ncbi:MFS transporter [Hamadaea tsunoensis]|uniref:MFS transporter n=1 Tax=Hamadaea tsunoensis TaxID=53368 RepID=UPI000489F853|nr:MFS transporter [Hamadaea tsunoensis]
METQTNTGHPRRWAILAVLVVSLLVVVLDNTVLNVALKVLADPQHGLGASQSQLEWAINSYTLVFAGLLFTFGVLGDRLGRKKVLVAGLVLFALTSLVSAYAKDPGQLIAARAAMGLAGAAIMATTLPIITNVFDPKERAKAIGAWAGAVGIGVAVGPIVGGALLENFWWGSIFMINLPIIAIGLIFVLWIVPDSKNPQPGRIDFLGVLLSIVGLAALVYGIIDGGQSGFDTPSVWAWTALGVITLGVFVWWESRTQYPALDVSLFKIPRFAAAVSLVGISFFAAMGVFFFISFYMQLVRGYSPLQTGLLMLPFAAAQMIFAPLSAGMVKRFGGKLVSAVGISIVSVATLGYLLVGTDSPMWILLVMFFVFGTGMANIMPPATEAVMASVPREKAGVGSAVNNTVRQVGGALGVAVLGSVLSSVYRSNISDTVAQVPAGAPAPAKAAISESIAGAHAVAENLGGTPFAGFAPALIKAADNAFVSAVHAAAIGSALVGLVGLIVVLLWLPGKAKTAAPAAKAPAKPDEELSPELALEAVEIG